MPRVIFVDFFLIKKNPRIKLISCHVSESNFYIQFGPNIRYCFQFGPSFFFNLVFLFLSKDKI